MLSRKTFILIAVGLVIGSVLMAFQQQNNFTTAGDWLFVYGMALLVLAALIWLLSGKFGFSVVRGFRLLMRGTSLSYYGKGEKDTEKEVSPISTLNKPARTMSNTTRFILLALFVGIVNVLLSIILVVLLD